MLNCKALAGERHVIHYEDERFPQALREIPKPPATLYVVGDPASLQEGLAIVGARKATPYGRSCAARFARLAGERGICIISGGARGCDAASHEAAISTGAPMVVFLGGGCDQIYPPEHQGLFQRIVDAGGAVVSENPWEFVPKPYTFRERNRLIAGLARATLIVEAGLPSGTFSTADEALAANREVLVVPGAITSAQSLGANRLICQGATPIVDDDTFYDQLFTIFGRLRQPDANVPEAEAAPNTTDSLFAALEAGPMDMDALMAAARDRFDEGNLQARLMLWLAEKERAGAIARYPDGRYGPAVRDGS